MEALYSKLYDNYIKLKTKKETELNKLHRNQEVNFKNYETAADGMIQYLKSENDRLREEHADYKKRLMEENQKNKELSEEIERLRNLQQETLCCGASTARDDKSENEQLNMPEDSPVGSDTSSGLALMSRKRSRHSGTKAEVTVSPSARDQHKHAPLRESAEDLYKQTMCSSTLLNIDQPKCCRRKIGRSGDINDTGPSSCIFQELVECLVDLKLSIATQSNEICVSAVHQLSGYSFRLTWVNNSGGESELLYQLLSLGTFEKVAPEWMRDVLMFGMKMCPVFFERVTRFVKLQR